ncbi:MAG: NAD(P)-dependent oxidoreductase [Elusimicrobia bacterium]|nr:NAD(P)-dependent oxidoreductase [Elusimicrobiota bacterium]MDE2426814.1 NAD(P)-dependent oxidoreductase [Elusimicrobiota bacterium]
MNLVTGGAGFLGSHLACNLLKRGEAVRVLDTWRSKYVPQSAEFIQGDMRDAARVEQAMRGVRKVFHLAFVQSLSKLPEAERWDINFNGTRNILEAASRAGVERFVHTSTIEIYGTKPPCPCGEDAPKDAPVGWYGRHKLEAERLVWKFHKERRLKATALRMPTICGPGYYNHRPTLWLMNRILAGRAVAVAGDGSTLGDFVHYEDVIQGYLLAADAGGAVGEAFNLSCKGPSTHLEILRAMIGAVGSRSRIIRCPKIILPPLLDLLRAFRIMDLPSCQDDYLLHHNAYSIEKAERLLGYAPAKTSAEAAAELIKSYGQDREFVDWRSRNY